MSVFTVEELEFMKMYQNKLYHSFRELEKYAFLGKKEEIAQTGLTESQDFDILERTYIKENGICMKQIKMN